MGTPHDKHTAADKERILAQRDEIIRDYQRGVLLEVIMQRYRMKNVKVLYKWVLDDGTRRVHVVPPEVREAILSAGPLSVRVLAAKFGYSKTTIHRIRTSGFDNWNDDERTIDDDESETVTFVPHSWRCPDHGRVTVSPCPICAARGITQRPAEFMPAGTNERNFESILVAQ